MRLAHRYGKRNERMIAILLAAGFVALAVFCAAVWLESMALTNPRGYRQPDPGSFAFAQTPRTAASLDYEDIEFAAPNNKPIRGWLVPAPGDARRLAVIALHGSGGDRTGVLTVLPVLHEAGAAVAAIDMRENGLSAGSGRGQAIGIRESQDAIAAADEMRRRGYEKVVLLGCSLGASAAILAAARDESIDGVIADSALSSFDLYVAEIADRRLARFGVRADWATAIWGRVVIALTRARLGLRGFERPEAAIGRIAPRPVLLIYGAEDSLTPADTHGEILMGRARAGASLWLVEGAGHCDAYSIDSERYRARVTALFSSIGAAN